MKMNKNLDEKNLIEDEINSEKQEIIDKEKFSRILNKIMEEKGIDNTELVKRTKISNSFLTELRKGKYSPSQKMLQKLARGLNVEKAIFYLNIEDVDELTLSDFAFYNDMLTLDKNSREKMKELYNLIINSEK